MRSAPHPAQGFPGYYSLLSTGEGTNPGVRKSFFMDSPLSENRSNNLLVYVAAVAAVVALVLGIVGLMKVSKVQKQLGIVNIVELSDKVAQSDSKAAQASTEARGAKNDVRTLQTLMERAVDQQLADIRGNIARIEDMAKQALDRPSVASGGGGGGGSAAGGGGGITITPGSLDPDGAYVVKSGDTFGRIAPQFGVTVAEIVAANPGVDPRRLRVGQKLIIPKK
jgi:LysM repeat protein